MTMLVVVRNHSPLPVLVHERSIAVVHCVVAHGDQSIHDEDHTEIEAELSPEATIPQRKNGLNYGVPQ